MSENASASPTGPSRRALVTGASSGIGAAFARRLARDGYDLVLVARSREALDSLAKELSESRGVGAEVLTADLTHGDELRVVEERLVSDPFELLVNNAGFGTVGPFADSDAEREEQEILLNVLALVRLTRAVLPRMLERGRGGIINVSSLAGVGPAPYMATYAATKGFVNNFSEAVGEEVRGSGVVVQVLQPGFTRTRFQERAGVDPDDVPGFAWMEADAVVEASLDALERGSLVCVPGLGNRALSLVSGAVPRAALRRVMGGFQGRRYRGGN